MDIWKPQFGTLLNRSNLFAHGLTASFLLNEKYGSVVHNYAQPIMSGALASGASWVPNAIEFTGDYERIDVSNTGGIIGGTKGSIAFQYKKTVTPSYYYFWHCDTNYANFSFVIDPGAPYNIFFYINGLQSPMSGGDALIDGNLHDVVATWDTDTNDVFIYLDGELWKSRNEGITPYTPTTFEMGGRGNSTGRYSGGNIYYFNVWDRVLNIDEAQSLNNNPYQMFQYPSILRYAGTTATGVTINATKGNLNIAGIDPVVSAGTTIEATKGNLNIAGANPVVEQTININSTKGNLNIAGINPVVEQTININSSKGNLNIAGINPEVEQTININSTKGNLNIAGVDPVVEQTININSTKGNLNIASINPEVYAGTTITATKGNLNIAGINPIVDLGVTITATKGNLNVASIDPAITVATIINATTGNLNVAGINPAVEQTININSTKGNLNIAGINPVVSASVLVSATLGTLVINGYNPYITIGDIPEVPLKRIYAINEDNRVYPIDEDDRTYSIE